MTVGDARDRKRIHCGDHLLLISSDDSWLTGWLSFKEKFVLDLRFIVLPQIGTYNR